MNNKYYSIHVHSEYSNIKIIDSINRYKRSIDYAWELGLSGVAMTEHDCISGSLKYLDTFYSKIKDEWKKLHPDEEYKNYNEMANELHFKPILGNEIYLSEEGLTEQTNDEMGGKGHFFHLILLAKDLEGFKQIKRLSSAAWRRAWFRSILRTPTYPSDLFKYVQGGHLICSTACLGGYTAYCWKQIANNDNAELYTQKLNNHLQMMQELFGKGNYFIELQPNEGKYGEEQNQYNQYMLKHYWGKYPFIFSTDAHYLKAEEKEIHKAFLNSKSSKDREVDEFYQKAYIMSQDEIRQLMPYVTDEQFNEMVKNTHRIFDMCSCYQLEQAQVVTKVQYEDYNNVLDYIELFFDVTKEEYPYFYDFIHSNDKTDKFFIGLIAKGFAEQDYPIDLHETYYKRLEEELWTIKEVSNRMGQNMADYFISMAKMIDIMWDKAESLVGPSRGSAGALLINYLLGITQMDPIKMELPFVWRFLHPSRPDMPDIDVDTESDKRSKVFLEVQKYFNSIGGDIVNICTFGTEGTKSALKTAGRGLNIDDDVITYLTSMIPNERGFDWSLHDCYYGNEEENRAPIKAFKLEIDKYPQLWELASNIEGLVTRLGVHASGVVAVNGDFIDYNSFMKTTKEQIVSAFDLHDSERMGLIKYDFLTVSALDRIRQTLNYLLEDGRIQWQGSLRKTYNKYLSPKVINYTDSAMWDMVGRGEISSLFQFDTLVGGQAIKEIQPHSLQELAIANSVMRLMSDSGEQPVDTYAKYKRAIALWYNEMKAHGLSEEEITLLEKYLKAKSGVADSQEVVMQIVMDPQISNFSMQEANKLRKTIAKKQFREIDKVKDLFFSKGKENGASQNLLSYIWYVQIARQLGYSFSTIHTTGYSLIALQEMNLAYQYPIIYWNCACLSVDSSAINSADFYNLIENDIVNIDENDEKKKTQNKMDYDKLASALDSFKTISNIKLPDINKSRLGFTPDAENNTIVYGLKGITRVTDPVINEIMINRPFKSFEDFLNTVPKKLISKDKVINLIKCGAFNELEHKTTKEILESFIWTTCEPKKKLTMQNANMLIDLNLLPKTLELSAEMYKLTKELRKNRDENRIWYFGDRLNVPYDKFEVWKTLIANSKIAAKTLMFNGESRKVLDSNLWDNYYNQLMTPIKSYIKEHHDELLNKLNQRLFRDEYQKYCTGDQLQWELDSLNFYFSGHPLDKVISEIPIQIDKLSNIIEGAQDGMFFIKGKEIPKMKLYTIAGTVIDKDKVKGIVTLQCPDGVINVKIYKDLFAIYNQTVSDLDENGEKEIEEESFFEKGTHLLVTGIKRGSTFVPKVYKNLKRPAILKIVLDEEGYFVTLEEKKGE